MVVEFLSATAAFSHALLACKFPWNAGLNSAAAKHRRATHMVFHCYVLSGKAQVGFCDARLDDHFLQELGVHLPARDARQKARTDLTGVRFNRPLPLGRKANKWAQTRLLSHGWSGTRFCNERASRQHEERLLISERLSLSPLTSAFWGTTPIVSDPEVDSWGESEEKHRAGEETQSQQQRQLPGHYIHIHCICIHIHTNTSLTVISARESQTNNYVRFSWYQFCLFQNKHSFCDVVVWATC